MEQEWAVKRERAVKGERAVKRDGNYQAGTGNGAGVARKETAGSGQDEKREFIPSLKKTFDCRTMAFWKENEPTGGYRSLAYI